MLKILEIRELINNHYDASTSFQEFFSGKKKADPFASYYTSKFLLQDSTEGLMAHRERGFGDNHLLSYIEFWGVLQAVIIQQDSIKTLYKLFLRKRLKARPNSKWIEVRRFRNLCGGHPAAVKEPRGKAFKVRYRSFFGRGAATYSAMNYEVWDGWKKADLLNGNPIVKTKEFGVLLDLYAVEAGGYMAEILVEIKRRWPIVE